MPTLVICTIAKDTFAVKKGGGHLAAKDILKAVEKTIAPVFEACDCELFDLEFVKEGPNWYLRIFADKEGGISIDDCEKISRQAEALLDAKDPIEQAYILEVSSPGIDRPLKKPSDYEKYKGEIVDIKLYKAIDKQKELQGVLLGLEGEIVSIETENAQKIDLKLSEIALCKLAVIF